MEKQKVLTSPNIFDFQFPACSSLANSTMVCSLVAFLRITTLLQRPACIINVERSLSQVSVIVDTHLNLILYIALQIASRRKKSTA